LAGTVTSGATPAITLSTSITGILKGNGTAISAASSGTDYAPATSGTSILYGNGAGGFSNVTIGTGVSFAGGTLSATGSGGTVTSVTGTAPVVSSGGTTPAISMAAATTSVNGYLTSTDWTTFNNKAPGVTFTSGYIPFGQGTTTLNQSASLYWNSANTRLGIGTSTPRWPIEVVSTGTSTTGLEQVGFFRKTTTNQVGASILAHDTLVAFGSNAYAGAGNVGVALLSQAAGVGVYTVYGFPSGGVSIGNTTDPGASNLSVSGTVTTGGYTVATLPTGVTGARAYVTNALAPAFGSAVAGGGAVTIPVFYNGANWIVG